MSVWMVRIGRFVPEPHSHEKSSIGNGVRKTVNAVRQNRLALSPIPRRAFEGGKSQVQGKPCQGYLKNFAVPAMVIHFLVNLHLA